MPVNCRMAPCLANAYSPFGSRASATSSSTSTKTSKNSPGAKRARPGARFLERRNQGDDNDKPCIHHQACDLGRPTNILVAVCVAESQILIQSFAELVAIQQKGTKASSIELFLQEIR